jgi:hypothetical protein
MSDLKVYCTKDWYRDYFITGRLIACSPSTRNNLLLEDREIHNDLNVRLSIDKRSHEISEIDSEWMGKELKPEGNWYDIIKR